MACPFSKTLTKEFIFFSTNIPNSYSYNTKRFDFYLTSSSLDPYSSSCSTSQRVSLRHGKPKKSLELERNRCGTLSVMQSSRNSNKENGSNMRWERSVAMKKQTLWRKILFGSKSQKIRSIILLNVITVVYGMNILFQAFASQNFDYWCLNFDVGRFVFVLII